MSTVTSPQPGILPAEPAPSPADVGQAGDQRIVIRGVDWDLYDRLSEAIGKGQHVRLIYDGKDLELTTAGYAHEKFEELVSSIVKAVTLGRGIDYMSSGQTTWKSADVGRGLEADLSYYFDPD